VDDIGIAASTDPVAVDRASVDLVEEKAGKTIGELLGNTRLAPHVQIDHAARIGLGSTDYELVEID